MTVAPAVMVIVSGMNAPLISIVVAELAGTDSVGGDSAGSGRSSNAVSIMLSSAFASGICSVVHAASVRIRNILSSADFSCMIVF